MLAVVRQRTVAALAQTGACALHRLAAIEPCCLGLNPNAAASRETCERNVLHRSASKSVRESGVVDDASAADVYAMMAVQRARRDKVSSKRWFFARSKQGVASIAGPGWTLECC